MIPASWSRGAAEEERLLWIEPDSRTWQDRRIADLPQLLRPGDLLVVNDAATLPASLRGLTDSGARVEVRLLAETGPATWTAVLFGPEDWRTDTDLRRAPRSVLPEERIALAGGSLRARVERLCERFPRLVRLRMESPRQEVLAAIYAHGRPIQYAYLADELSLEAVQTPYASRPWAVEMPSAGRPLRWGLLLQLCRRGIGLAAVTHAAGLSSIGDPDLDAALPFPEAFDVPEHTVDAVRTARSNGGRVVAVGTTVARALEGCARLHGGGLRAGRGSTDLRIGPDFEPQVVDGILTNMHEPGESHFELLRAFAPDELLARSMAHAEDVGYLAHEFGDSCLILGRRKRVSPSPPEGRGEEDKCGVDLEPPENHQYAYRHLRAGCKALVGMGGANAPQAWADVSQRHGSR